MKITAVIGANFGDEGKGLLTDYLCANHPRSLVIRFNGGAQAGHTVVTPEGRRHVFHHFGSGALAGADTYLSQFFIVNPLLWRDEFKELNGVKQKVFMHPDALLSTPWDMMFNQALERSRGADRHGSCGIGINETVVRCRGPYRTTLRDIFSKRLVFVRDYYTSRAKEYGIDLWTVPQWNSLNLWLDYINCCDKLVKNTIIEPLEDNTQHQWDNIVFEGAQGLLLDEDHEYRPHVTTSKTGVDNVKTLCEIMGLGKDIELVYVTRSYLTRHGPGPFPTEDKGLAFSDETNITNNWQGSLRFGWLDAAEVRARIWLDAEKINLKPSLAVTCLDQMDTLNLIKHNFRDFEKIYEGRGPTRNDVKRTKL